MIASTGNSNALLNIARWVERSAVNGPGERFVLWLQGCPLRCPGCWNPDTWDFAPRHLVSVDEVIRAIDAASGIEGVTFTGGEPLAQAAALIPLAAGIRERGLSLMVFSGYRLNQLVDPPARELLSYADILVDGQFIRARRDLSLPWRGSRNQRVHFLTSRYTADSMHQAGRLEVHIHADASASVTGFPTTEFIDEMSRV